MVFNWSVFAFSLLVIQCSLIEGRAISDGSIVHISENRLTNDRFGLSVEIPKDWTVMVDKDSNKPLGAAVTSNLIIPVFGISKYPIGSSDTNPNIMALAAKNEDESDRCAPLVASRRLISLLLSAKFIGDCREIKINGMTFSMQELVTKREASKTLYQTQYGYLTNDGHFITIAMAYFDVQDKEILDGIMQSLSFSS